MGYFDKLTESAFKQSKTGESIYFPNGVLGKGRLVKDVLKKDKLFKFHKRLNKYLVPFGVLYGMLIGLGGGLSMDSILPILIIGIIVFIRQRYLIWGLPIHDERLTLGEATTSVSKAFHPALLVVMGVNGILLILLSLSLPFILEESYSEALFLVLTLSILGVLSLWFSIYFYKRRKLIEN